MKRILSPSEIDYILSDIHPIHSLCPDIADRIFQDIRQRLVTDLQTQKVYPEVIPLLREKITHFYYTTQVQPGDSVGIATAQSIGERQTQLALDSFHSTGITTLTVVTGVPRFNELINATKKPRSVITKVYPSKKYKSVDTIRTDGNKLKHITFKEVVVDYHVYPKRMCRDKWYFPFKHLYTTTIAHLGSCTHYVRIWCDMQCLFTYQLSLRSIADAVKRNIEDVVCVWSPLTIGCIDVWFNSRDLSIPKNKTYITHENKALIFTEEVLLPRLYATTIRGVRGIDNINYTIYNDEWIMETMGSNLKNVSSLQKLFEHPFVDTKRTISNHMWELFNVLGIEATREFLIQEFVDVISVESYVNKRHIQLLVDIMLYTGSISSISRYGVHRNQAGALTKCSFEESLDQMLDAGTYGEVDNLTGVSSAIICGKVSNIGSGMCDILYNDQ